MPLLPLSNPTQTQPSNPQTHTNLANLLSKSESLPLLPLAIDTNNWDRPILVSLGANYLIFTEQITTEGVWGAAYNSSFCYAQDYEGPVVFFQFNNQTTHPIDIVTSYQETNISLVLLWSQGMCCVIFIVVPFFLSFFRSFHCCVVVLTVIQ